MTITSEFARVVAIVINYRPDTEDQLSRRIAWLHSKWSERYGDSPSIVDCDGNATAEKISLAPADIGVSYALAHAALIRALEMYRYGNAWYGQKCDLVGYSLCGHGKIRNRKYVRAFVSVSDMDLRLGDNSDSAVYKLRYGNSGIPRDRCPSCKLVKTMCVCIKNINKPMVYLQTS
jgi:hypothetical protein